TLTASARFGRHAYGLDVIAVRITDVRAVIVLVVLRKEPRTVQRLGPQTDRGRMKGIDAGPVGGSERDVGLAAGRGDRRPDPEFRAALAPEPERAVDLQHQRRAERSEHGLVKPAAGRKIAGLQRYVRQQPTHFTPAVSMSRSSFFNTPISSRNLAAN